MSSLIDCVYNANDKINIKLSGTGDKVKIITLDDIPSVVKLYQAVYGELEKANCGKFIHKMDEEALEELISQDGTALVGYFKEGKHLAGTVYAKPFGKNSPFFQTPVFEGDKTTYAIGGLVVDSQHRGNGVVSKITSSAVSGVKEYAKKDSSICGAGIEVSCENFGSLRALGAVKDESQNPIFNFAGIHYLEQPEEKDNDLTVLGYTSFEQDAITGLMLPNVTLGANQLESFDKLTDAMQVIGEQSGGIDVKDVGGHKIALFSNYIDASINEIVKYDPVYSASYPPQLDSGLEGFGQ